MNIDNSSEITPKIDTTPTVEEVKTNAFKQDVEQVRSLVNKLKEGIKQKRELAKKNKEEQLALDAQEGGSRLPKKGHPQRKLIIVCVIVLVFLTILLIGASLYKSLSNKNIELTVPSPSPEIQVNVDPFLGKNLSKYATDSAIVDIDKKINDLGILMQNTNIREPQLSVPNLDFEVDF